MNGLDLFSGIGGLTIALSEWVKPIAYCESDPYAQAVLMSRMWNRDIPRCPIWDDVRTLRGSSFEGTIDIIYGGFPCQDISSAGYGVGLGGERSGLFQHIIRLVEETNPRFVFLENVSAIRTRGLNGVAQAFTDIGYDFRWTIVSAKEVGACHIRKRWFGLANLESERREEGGLRLRKTPANPILNVPTEYEGWDIWKDPEPLLDGKVHGISARVDRIKALGNAVVPFQAKEAFMRLSGLYSKGESK